MDRHQLFLKDLENVMRKHRASFVFEVSEWAELKVNINSEEKHIKSYDCGKDKFSASHIAKMED